VLPAPSLYLPGLENIAILIVGGGLIRTGELDGHSDDSHVDWADGDGGRVVRLGRERPASDQLTVTDHLDEMTACQHIITPTTDAV